MLLDQVAVRDLLRAGLSDNQVLVWTARILLRICKCQAALGRGRGRCGRATPAMRGATDGSHSVQTPPDSLTTTSGICRGDRLSARLPRTCPDPLSVPRGQGSTTNASPRAGPTVALEHAWQPGQLSSDNSVSGSTGAFKYDALNQLCYAGSATTNACSSPPSAATAYAFDAADNLTTNNGTTQQFDAADRLCWTIAGTSANTCASPPTGATTYSYDNRGNRTAITPHTGTATSLGYDQANQLDSVIGPASATYAYDGNGLRSTKTTGGATTHYTWGTDQVPNLLQETTSSNTTSYIYGPDGLPIEQITPGGAVLYYSHDQLGSTRLITDTSAVTKATYTYDPYGNITSSSVSVPNPLQYDGQYTDAETGLIYLRNRYYDPTTAQFLTQDPAISTSSSPYAYVAGNPLNATDLAGLYPGEGLVNKAKRYLGDVTKGTKSVAVGAWHHRDAVVTVLAIGTCVSGVGTALCVGASAVAFGFRAELRVQQDGFAGSLTQNLADAGFTTITGGLASGIDAWGDGVRLAGLIPAAWDYAALSVDLYRQEQQELAAFCA